jgi:uncharacterized damage-inducible protein DinB
MKAILVQQYELVRSSRSALHNYCATISQPHFVEVVPGFGKGGSIRHLLVHITNTYNYWLGTHCMSRDEVFNEYTHTSTMQQCAKLYDEVDELVFRFLDHFENRYNEDIQGKAAVASPFKAFTHVITHEYHHKGQILTMSRLLGYQPVDTDVIR